MSIRLVLFSLGVIAVSFFPYLPPLDLLWGIPVLVWPSVHYRRAYGFVAFLLGIGWGIYTGHQLVSAQLHESLAGRDLQVIGVITDLPEAGGQRLRFNVNIRHAFTTRGDVVDQQDFPDKVQLSWYPAYAKNKAVPIPSLTVGQVWQLKVRLKRPRGFANPSGFDYHAWLLRQGIGATGYVANSKQNLLLENQSAILNGREWIDYQRQLLQQWVLSRSNSTERGILIALLIGDAAHVEKQQWNRMQQTGTSHLIAISGLHVGFLALFGFYLGLGVGKCIQLVWRACPAFVIAWVMAIFCAGFYSALAGFNIPTVRTLIMLGIFYCACLWQRSVRITDIFCCALALVVIIDPLAAYDMGFWLSFGAVALLLFYFSGRWVAKTNADQWRGFSWRNLAIGFIHSQWVMFIGLLIPLSALASSVSLVAPLANAVAIPLITFLVVPLLLVSAVLNSAVPILSDLLLEISALAMEWLALVLQIILDAAGDYASPIIAFSPTVILLVALGCLVLLMPKGLIPRAVGWCGLAVGLAFGYFIPAVNSPDLKITTLDVGQGTAVVVQVKDKTLVYDTGPKYTDSFDAGGAIVAPYLFAQAISTIDALVISHADMDHAGGLASFLEKVKVRKILLGDSDMVDDTAIARVNTMASVATCHTQERWRWHNVAFEFLPLSINNRTTDNNKSCVLLIRYRDQTLFLPGDIEARVENQLLREKKIPRDLTLVLAAHHGSRTSSTPRFVQHARPGYVIYSAGFRSQHGHPHPLVRRRYQAVPSREFNTAESGAVMFEWYADKAPVIHEQRKAQRRYWFD